MPHSFHGYDVEKQIGAGGMSTVFCGAHKNLGFKVAIKILHPALSMDQHFVARFEREARAASSLASSQIARVIDFGEEAGVYFIVMEYVDGKDLGQLFRELQAKNGRPVPLPTEIVLLLLEDIAYGLLKAHEQNIIHRDIKPSNVLLSSDGEVKIVDFGLARDVRLAPGEWTHTGMVIGTPSYMSPEQAVGGRKLDARTDIFSLGVMAYQFLTGEKPFQGETASAIQETIINSVPAPLTPERCPLLTPEIDTFVARCLEKDPEKRYPSMKRVVEALECCFESIDESGSLSRRRRPLLREFATDPKTAAQDLRHQAISAHLRRGFHYKSMGREKLEDAERELRVVLSLDPGNKKATDALAELQEHRDDETIIKPASDSAQPDPAQLDPTRIVDSEGGEAPDGPVSEATPPIGRPARKRRRRPFVVGALLTLALAGAALIILGDKERVTGEQVAVDVPQEPAVELTPPVVERPPIEPPPPAPPPVVELPPSPPSQKGHLILDLPERLDIYLDGRRIRTDTGPIELEVEPDRQYAVEVRNPRAHARLPLGSFSVEPGAQRPIGPIAIRYGALTLAVNAEVEIKVNDALIAVSTRDIERMRLGAGEHELTVTAPEGYRVERAFVRTADGGRVPLERSGGDDKAARYRINVPHNGELILGFIVR